MQLSPVISPHIAMVVDSSLRKIGMNFLTNTQTLGEQKVVTLHSFLILFFDAQTTIAVSLMTFPAQLPPSLSEYP